MVYLGFPADFGALIGEIARHPSGHPTAVALVPATFLGPSIPGSVQSDQPAFRRIACRPILPAAAVPAVVCYSAGSIDFAQADSVVAAVSAATVVAADVVRTAVVVASDSVPNSVAIAIAIAGFAATAAGSVV